MKPYPSQRFQYIESAKCNQRRDKTRRNKKIQRTGRPVLVRCPPRIIWTLIRFAQRTQRTQRYCFILPCGLCELCANLELSLDIFQHWYKLPRSGKRNAASLTSTAPHHSIIPFSSALPLSRTLTAPCRAATARPAGPARRRPSSGSESLWTSRSS